MEIHGEKMKSTVFLFYLVCMADSEKSCRVKTEAFALVPAVCMLS